jgi:hypothetical protein
MGRRTEHDEMAVISWLLSRDTGISSKAMVRRIVVGDRPEADAYPRDPADFGRCLRLLERVPTIKTDLRFMRDVSPQWAALLDRWIEVEALYNEEMPSGRAPKCFALMKAIQESAEAGRTALQGEG